MVSFFLGEVSCLSARTGAGSWVLLRREFRKLDLCMSRPPFLESNITYPSGSGPPPQLLPSLSIVVFSGTLLSPHVCYCTESKHTVSLSEGELPCN